MYTVPLLWHLKNLAQNMKQQQKVDTLTHYSIIAPFDAFEISCIWKYYGQWSICSFGANAPFSIIFSKNSNLTLILSWIFSMLSKNRKWSHDLKIAYGQSCFKVKLKYFLTHLFSNMFRVLKRTVSLTWLFWVTIRYFWLRGKKIKFWLQTFPLYIIALYSTGYFLIMT